MSRSLKTTSTNKVSDKTNPRERSKDRSNTLIAANKNIKDSNKSKSVNKTKDSPRTVITNSSLKRTLKSDTDNANKKGSTKSSLGTSKTTTSTSRTNISVKPKRPTVVPDAASSSRVTRTQYFPSKKLYSNAIQQQNNLQQKVTKSGKPEASNVRAKTRTVDKKLKINSVEEERPRTATLRKGNIVNSNIAGPDIPKSETPSISSVDLSLEAQVPDESVDNYEDDFDSYESDFEEYQSSDATTSSSTPPSRSSLISTSTSSSSSSLPEKEKENLKIEITANDDLSLSADASKRNTSAGTTDEERMLDSGNFDMSENKLKQSLYNIKESTEKQIFLESSRSNMASLSDEGFEDGKPAAHSASMQFINFAVAQKKRRQSKNMQKRRKRGEEILGMIRLDHYNFTLIDMPPVSYDDFIKFYGTSNTIQVSVQTGDDDTHEEIQTDVIEVTNKWTQFPVTFSKIQESNPNYMEIYRKEYLGVGDDNNNQIAPSIPHFSNKRLDNFLNSASKIILTLLEESVTEMNEQIYQNSREIPFSQGFIEFNVNVHPLLKNRPLNFVSCYSEINIKILTVHGRKEIANEESGSDDFSLKCLVCIWSLANLKEPNKILTVTGEPSCSICISEAHNLIFCGLRDGSITVWDINTSNSELVDAEEEDNQFKKSVYTTAIDSGHSSEVVAVHLVKNINSGSNYDNSLDWKSSNDQVYSLDENGLLIIWGIIVRDTRRTTFHSRISLVQNSKMFLPLQNPDLTGLKCTNMNINPLDQNHIFVSTNYGLILHCLSSGAKATPRKYNPTDIITQANCIECCPFSPLYFFIGHENGTVSLYSRLLEKPLISMSNKDDNFQSGVQLLQWSEHKPCIFYAIDRSNTIHVWDLAVSDFFPIYSIPFEENIICMKLSPIMNSYDRSYMILAMESGLIHLHILNGDYGPNNTDKYQQELRNFLNYVDRL